MNTLIIIIIIIGKNLGTVDRLLHLKHSHRLNDSEHNKIISSVLSTTSETLAVTMTQQIEIRVKRKATEIPTSETLAVNMTQKNL